MPRRTEVPLIIPEKCICYGYLRSFPEMQSDGPSIEVQKFEIERWINEKGYVLQKYFSDLNSSGEDIENRPEFLEMLKTVKEGEMIVVSDLNKFSRNAHFTIQQLDEFRKERIIFKALDLISDMKRSEETFMLINKAGLAEFEIGRYRTLQEREEKLRDSHRG